MNSVLLIIVSFIVTPFFGFCQLKKINFSSKESKGITVNDKRFLILWNKVKFNHSNTIMFCDSAIYERVNNSFVAYDNVKINENDSLHIYGDSIHYFGNHEKAYIYGNVLVKSNRINLTTNTLIYDQKLKIAYYTNGAIVKDIEKGYEIKSQKGIFNTQLQKVFFRDNVQLDHKDYKIISDSLVYHTNTQKSDIIGNAEIQTNKSSIFCNQGWFDSKNNKASFKKNVIIKSQNQLLYADSIFYNETSGISYAEGNVKIEDDSNNIVIKGNYGIYNEKIDSMYVWKNASFSQINKSDTINIYADKFISFSDSIKRIFICYNNAVIDGNLIQGDCDSIFYNKTDSLLKCIDKPVIWMDENQISGEKLEFKIFEGEIYKMNVTDNSLIITKKDSVHFDQIKGNDINGFFEKNELKILDVNDNGQAIYYTLDESDSLINEINIITCESMRIFIENNNIEKIKFNKKPNGKTEPLNNEKENLYLENFKVFPKKTYQEKYLEPNGESPKGN